MQFRNICHDISAFSGCESVISVASSRSPGAMCQCATKWDTVRNVASCSTAIYILEFPNIMSISSCILMMGSVMI